jgi:glutamate dehydrogenase (NADP+)
VYFLEDMLGTVDEAIEGRAVVTSGAGNVATHAAEKVVHRGGRALTLSDSAGFVHAEEGLTMEQVERIKAHKAKPGAKLSEIADELGLAHHEVTPWAVPCDAAMPCATQNELDGEAARALLDNGCRAISEGANMPCTHDAVTAFRDAGILYGPGKAANAGGVAMSGLEMSQNAARLSRGADDLRESLRRIMSEIHDLCAEHGRRDDGSVDYVAGANIAGFRKVADAMLAFGVV